MEYPNKRYFLEAHIVNHIINEETTFPYSKYIEYELMLNTKYKIWTINKRYSKFEELHKKLSKVFKKLPTLPKKAFFNFGEKLIEERKLGLQNYLNQLFHMINFYSNVDLLEFLEIDREVLLLMTKSNTFVDPTKKNMTFINRTENKNNTFAESYESAKLSLTNENNLKHQNFTSIEIQNRPQTETDVINEFVESLEQRGGNKINSIDNFVTYLKSKKWPSFKKEDIARLLFGNLNNNKGLIYHCGTTDENQLGAEACIKLFGKLISFEFNPDCEYYIQILKKMPLSHLRKMKLMEHIKYNDIKEICFKILKIIKDEKENVFNQLVGDLKLFEKNEAWILYCNQKCYL